MYAQSLIADRATVYAGPDTASDGLEVQTAATAGIGGLDRFVYLRGASSRRYVFSAVPADRAGLYDSCVFAWREAGAKTAQPCERPPQTAHSGQLYVHLADGVSPASVLADLRAACED